MKSSFPALTIRIKKRTNPLKQVLLLIQVLVFCSFWYPFYQFSDGWRPFPPFSTGSPSVAISYPRSFTWTKENSLISSTRTKTGWICLHGRKSLAFVLHERKTWFRLTWTKKGFISSINLAFGHLRECFFFWGSTLEHLWIFSICSSFHLAMCSISSPPFW